MTRSISRALLAVTSASAFLGCGASSPEEAVRSYIQEHMIQPGDTFGEVWWAGRRPVGHSLWIGAKCSERMDQVGAYHEPASLHRIAEITADGLQLEQSVGGTKRQIEKFTRRVTVPADATLILLSFNVTHPPPPAEATKQVHRLQTTLANLDHYRYCLPDRALNAHTSRVPDGHGGLVEEGWNNVSDSRQAGRGLTRHLPERKSGGGMVDVVFVVTKENTCVMHLPASFWDWYGLVSEEPPRRP